MKEKEVLKLAKEIMEKDPSLTKWILTKFPELEESEDERVRKALINIFKKYQNPKFHLDPNKWEGLEIPKILAWLEKQGKNNMGISEATKKELEDNLNKALEKETPESWNKFLDEQKPTDKVEPKFKVEKDKWYVCTSQYCNCIEGRNYKASLDGRIIDDYGTEYDMHSDAYRWFRPWTIQDAKDGDVLVSNYDSFIVIFKGLSYLEDDIDRFKSYCHCREGIFSSIEDPNWCCNAFYPATKEQRDLLFQKMKEAGYKWDEKTKKLVNSSLKKKEEIDTGFTKMIKKREDKKMIENIISDLKGLKENETNEELISDYEREIEWLKEKI